jgi:hypothetical protein
VTQKILACLAALALVACSKTAAPPETAAAPDTTAAPASTEASAAEPATGDICALVSNPEATFGQPVTSSTESGVTGNSCIWKSADGRACGILNVFGPGYNPMPNAQVQYGGMTTSLKAFGEVKEVAGIGEAASAVDGGPLLGAQVAFRTSTHAVLAASACSSGNDKAPALAEKLAREVATRL